MTTTTTTEINERLAQLVDHMTGGRQGRFAVMVGWAPQYLGNLLKGASGIGINPVFPPLFPHFFPPLFHSFFNDC